ncbi:hypothetical protein HMPREF9065_00184 [Aggregatibacter sp. oral taxon 458 str. W10330]|nr:hypothetical protein HMPREF9065_00184 [Aggregatibacter sp. oral taxon 458 str. W10330]
MKITAHQVQPQKTPNTVNTVVAARLKCGQCWMNFGMNWQKEK